MSWHSPLDGSESRIQHMLMCDDAQLHPITTQFGIVHFVQVCVLALLVIESILKDVLAMTSKFSRRPYLYKVFKDRSAYFLPP